MKVLLINQNPVIKKLVGIASKKLNVEIENVARIAPDFNPKNYILIVVDDENVGKNLDQLTTIQDHVKVCLLFSRKTQIKKHEFNIAIQKPFLPTDILEILNDCIVQESQKTSTTDFHNLHTTNEIEMDLSKAEINMPSDTNFDDLEAKPSIPQETPESTTTASDATLDFDPDSLDFSALEESDKHSDLGNKESQDNTQHSSAMFESDLSNLKAHSADDDINSLDLDSLMDEKALQEASSGIPKSLNEEAQQVADSQNDELFLSNEERELLQPDPKKILESLEEEENKNSVETDIPLVAAEKLPPDLHELEGSDLLQDNEIKLDDLHDLAIPQEIKSEISENNETSIPESNPAKDNGIQATINLDENLLTNEFLNPEVLQDEEKPANTEESSTPSSSLTKKQNESIANILDDINIDDMLDKMVIGEEISGSNVETIEDLEPQPPKSNNASLEDVFSDLESALNDAFNNSDTLEALKNDQSSSEDTPIKQESSSQDSMDLSSISEVETPKQDKTESSKDLEDNALSDRNLESSHDGEVNDNEATILDLKNFEEVNSLLKELNDPDIHKSSHDEIIGNDTTKDTEESILSLETDNKNNMITPDSLDESLSTLESINQDLEMKDDLQESKTPTDLALDDIQDLQIDESNPISNETTLDSEISQIPEEQKENITLDDTLLSFDDLELDNKNDMISPDSLDESLSTLESINQDLEMKDDLQESKTPTDLALDDIQDLQIDESNPISNETTLDSEISQIPEEQKEKELSADISNNGLSDLSLEPHDLEALHTDLQDQQVAQDLESGNLEELLDQNIADLHTTEITANDQTEISDSLTTDMINEIDGLSQSDISLNTDTIFENELHEDIKLDDLITEEEHTQADLSMDNNQHNESEANQLQDTMQQDIVNLSETQNTSPDAEYVVLPSHEDTIENISELQLAEALGESDDSVVRVNEIPNKQTNSLESAIKESELNKDETLESNKGVDILNLDDFNVPQEESTLQQEEISAKHDLSLESDVALLDLESKELENVLPSSNIDKSFDKQDSSHETSLNETTDFHDTTKSHYNNTTELQDDEIYKTDIEDEIQESPSIKNMDADAFFDFIKNTPKEKLREVFEGANISFNLQFPKKHS